MEALNGNGDEKSPTIAKSEKLLFEMVECRNKLYAYNVVDYDSRTATRISAFYNYLKTGRCDSLTGPKGAYNLFESEFQHSMMMLEMSEIKSSINNLGQTITNAQNAICKRLDELNISMNKLKDAVGNVSASLKDIKVDLKELTENSSVIAYNTAATAYYSKLNANLTDSLGYLVAFK